MISDRRAQAEIDQVRDADERDAVRKIVESAPRLLMTAVNSTIGDETMTSDSIAHMMRAVAFEWGRVLPDPNRYERAKEPFGNMMLELGRLLDGLHLCELSKLTKIEYSYRQSEPNLFGIPHEHFDRLNACRAINLFAHMVAGDMCCMAMSQTEILRDLKQPITRSQIEAWRDAWEAWHKTAKNYIKID